MSSGAWFQSHSYVMKLCEGKTERYCPLLSSQFCRDKGASESVAVRARIYLSRTRTSTPLQSHEYSVPMSFHDPFQPGFNPYPCMFRSILSLYRRAVVHQCCVMHATEDSSVSGRAKFLICMGDKRRALGQTNFRLPKHARVTISLMLGSVPSTHTKIIPGCLVAPMMFVSCTRPHKRLHCVHLLSPVSLFALFYP
ncbi:unnamed protein product [Ixodes pacificus]